MGKCFSQPHNHTDKDDLLVSWRREDAPFLELPPAIPELAGWRDPFIFETGGNGKEWGMLIGTGFKDRGGATLVYRSHDLRKGWRVVGMLCEADDLSTGKMWECPILVKLHRVPESTRSQTYRGLHKWSSTDSFSFGKPSASLTGSMEASGGSTGEVGLLPTSDVLLANPKSMLVMDDKIASAGGDAGASKYTHLFCVSPDAPVNPVLYWVGSYDAERVKFDLENARGPFKLVCHLIGGGWPLLLW